MLQTKNEDEIEKLNAKLESAVNDREALIMKVDKLENDHAE